MKNVLRELKRRRKRLRIPRRNQSPPRPLPRSLMLRVALKPPLRAVNSKFRNTLYPLPQEPFLPDQQPL